MGESQTLPTSPSCSCLVVSSVQPGRGTLPRFMVLWLDSPAPFCPRRVCAVCAVTPVPSTPYLAGSGQPTGRVLATR